MPDKPKNPHAQALARARAASLTPEERSTIAQNASIARWSRAPREVVHRLIAGTRQGQLVLQTPVVVVDQGSRRPAWVCRCDCGTVKEVTERALIHLKRQSCGCAKATAARSRSPEKNKEIADKMHAARWAKHVLAQHKLAAGGVIGRLTLVTPTHIVQEGGKQIGRRFLAWECQCSCGNTTTVTEANLARQVEGVRSCGCLRAEIHRTANGDARVGDVASEYSTWMNLRRRCTDPTNNTYPRYGGRGIKVCDRWNDPDTGYLAFLADMGRKPSPKHSIDRVDNDQGYSPENCRWATAAEQVRNSSNAVMVTVGGVTQCLVDWSKSMGMSYSRVRKLHASGGLEEEILRRHK